MIQSGIQGMVFSNFRKDVDTPLFEIYSPKIDEKVDQDNKKIIKDEEETSNPKDIVSKQETVDDFKEETSIFNQLKNERNFYAQMETNNQINEKDEESEISSDNENLFQAVLTMPETSKSKKNEGINNI